MYLFIYPSTYLFIYPPFFLPIYPSIASVLPSVCLFILPSTYLFIYPTIFPFILLSVYPFISRLAYLSSRLAILPFTHYPSIHPSSFLHQSILQSAHSLTCTFTHLSVAPSISPISLRS